MGLISPSKTEGKLDRGFREIKETAPLQTEGAVVECLVTSRRHNHLNTLESQKTKTRNPKKLQRKFAKKKQKNSLLGAIHLRAEISGLLF